ncbi:unnamed protein product [Thelazia callipaeda]|uniref:Uncharacterized protein n=1 Tax=Thelazia callipaeda TaxID=103827 RepID=A0A0N5CXT8_THECL|nr:unnamed protein product [Thelazia callipaeda]
MPLKFDQSNSLREKDSRISSRSNFDTESSADEMKPLKNLSDESDLSRSVMASISSEQQDEDVSYRNSSIKK